MGSRRGMFTDLQHKIFVGGLVAMLAWSVVAAIIRLPPTWQIPPVFMALLAIVKMVAPLEQIDETVQSIQSSVEAQVKRYGGAEDFYADLSRSVRRAGTHIDLTHIRDSPPEDFKGSAPTGYFNYLLDWLAVSRSRTIRRVICVRNAKMRAWALQLHDAADKRPNLHVRVIECGAETPIINMAILDNSEVYITFTGDIPERTPGVSIKDPAISRYFSEYYSTLWRAAEPLDSYLLRS